MASESVMASVMTSGSAMTSESVRARVMASGSVRASVMMRCDGEWECDDE